MKKIALIADSISFTNFAIIYNVRLFEGVLENINPIILCNDDICRKDLIMKPTALSKDNMRVIFTPGNVTPQFYQDLLNKSLKNHQEYQTELKYIYNVGDIVGYVIEKEANNLNGLNGHTARIDQLGLS